MVKNWLPLESNPEVLTEFAEKIGLEPGIEFADVFSIDEPELLAMVPQPVGAVFLLFPVTEATEAMQDGTVMDAAAQAREGLYYMKQTVGNACGTIALLHALCNLHPARASFQPDSFLSRFHGATLGMTPEERGRFLEEPPEDGPSLDAAHKEAAEQGQTKPPAEDEDVNLHFVAFVESASGRLVELDGRRPGPIDHGPVGGAGLLEASIRVVRRFMEVTGSVSFNMMVAAVGGGGGGLGSHRARWD